MTNQVIVDTRKLEEYANRLLAINRRLDRLDNRLDHLYLQGGLGNVLKLAVADSMVGSNYRIRRCAGYLNQASAIFQNAESNVLRLDPLTYQSTGRKFTSAVELAAEAVGRAAVSTAALVGSQVLQIGQAVTAAADFVSSRVVQAKQAFEDGVYQLGCSYYSGGWVYKTVQVGKSVLVAAKGVAQIVAGVGIIAGTAGAGSIVGVLPIISGINDVANSVRDATYACQGKYDQMGGNYLKDTMAEGGGILGKSLGNEEIGEMVGTGFYYGVEIVSMLAVLGTSLDKVTQANPTNLSKLSNELAEIGKINVNSLLTTDIQTLAMKLSLAKMEFASVANCASNIKLVFDVGQETWNLASTTATAITGIEPDASQILDMVGDLVDNTPALEPLREVQETVQSTMESMVDQYPALENLGVTQTTIQKVADYVNDWREAIGNVWNGVESISRQLSPIGI